MPVVLEKGGGSTLALKSLLYAVVADGVSGDHNSSLELAAQGVQIFRPISLEISRWQV